MTAEIRHVTAHIAYYHALCIVVHFQPVIKLLQKGVRVHHRRVILMQKNAKFLLGGAQPPPQTPPPVGRGTPLPTLHPPRLLRLLDLNPSHSKNSAYTTRHTPPFPILSSPGLIDLFPALLLTNPSLSPLLPLPIILLFPSPPASPPRCLVA